MFLGLSQSTCTSMAPDPDEVLVVNSDDELTWIEEIPFYRIYQNGFLTV